MAEPGLSAELQGPIWMCTAPCFAFRVPGASVGKSSASAALFGGVSLQHHDMVTVMGCLYPACDVSLLAWDLALWSAWFRTASSLASGVVN